jgi:hypothetical protein
MCRTAILVAMNTYTALLATALLSFSCIGSAETPDASEAPRYQGEHLVLPTSYREWIYLTSGFDMSYSAAAMPGHHMFDNVFVAPSAYRAFLATGTWPDKTLLVLEARGAKDKGSINKHGNFQGEEVMGREVHVKDESRGGWSFFQFDDKGVGSRVPQTEACYSCHQSHAAVDTTFVQFYPTLLPIARDKGTLSSSYEP